MNYPAGGQGSQSQNTPIGHSDGPRGPASHFDSRTKTSMGRMEFCDSCLLHLRTEMAAVEKLPSQSSGISPPKGSSIEPKTPSGDFWDRSDS